MAMVTIVPEALCPELIDEAAAFEAVAAVFAAMARSEARNFPVVRAGGLQESGAGDRCMIHQQRSI